MRGGTSARRKAIAPERADSASPRYRYETAAQELIQRHHSLSTGPLDKLLAYQSPVLNGLAV